MRITLLLLVACGGGSNNTGDVDSPTPGCVPVAGLSGLPVMTTNGPIGGAIEGATVAFKGVPYAQPPVGTLRWEAPIAPECTALELDATAFGPACPQLDENDSVIGAEDCLHLNIWAPSVAAAPRPVMVWIHGGGNAQGTASDPIYDGRHLAEAGDLVVVTINYRLGQLGFLADPSLGAGAGNYGLLDQIAALAWVRDNIAAFGGDAGNVTIFGESAGARDVCALLATPGSAGMFHRAIMQSGGCIGLPTRMAAEATAASYASMAGCASGDAACLRALDVDTAIRTNAPDVSVLASQPYQPTVGTDVLPDQAQAVIEAGQHHAVPFLIGANADETNASAPAIPNETAYMNAVNAQLPPPVAAMALQQYPAANFPTPRAAFVRLTTDARFVCPSRGIAKAVTASQTAPVYRYFFQFRPSPVGAVHGLDVPYVFGSFDAVIVNGQPYAPTATDLAVSAEFQGYWTRFARTGDPAGAPAWPEYTTGDPTLVIDSTTTTIDGVRTGDCDFWEPFYDLL